MERWLVLSPARARGSSSPAAPLPPLTGLPMASAPRGSCRDGSGRRPRRAGRREAHRRGGGASGERRCLLKRHLDPERSVDPPSSEHFHYILDSRLCRQYGEVQGSSRFPHYVKLRFAPLCIESCRADPKCSNRAATRVGYTRTEQKAAPLRHLGFGLDKRSFGKVRKHKYWLY